MSRPNAKAESARADTFRLKFRKDAVDFHSAPCGLHSATITLPHGILIGFLTAVSLSLFCLLLILARTKINFAQPKLSHDPNVQERPNTQSAEHLTLERVPTIRADLSGYTFSDMLWSGIVGPLPSWNDAQADDRVPTLPHNSTEISEQRCGDDDHGQQSPLTRQ